jgi:hypothetical protein
MRRLFIVHFVALYSLFSNINRETGKMYSDDDLFIDMMLNATASGMPDDLACVNIAINHHNSK